MAGFPLGWCVYLTAWMVWLIYWAANVVFISRCMTSEDRRQALLSSLRSKFAGFCFSDLCALLSRPLLAALRRGPAEQDDPDEHAAHQLISSRKLQTCRSAISIMVHVMALSVGGFLHRPHGGLFGTGCGSSWPDILSNCYLSATVVPLFPLLLLLWLRPAWVTLSRVDAIYALVSARLMWSHATILNAHRISQMRVFSIPVRLGFGLVIGNPWLVTIVNVTYAFVACAMNFRRSSDFWTSNPDAEWEEVACHEKWSPWGDSGREIISLGVMVVCCFLSEHALMVQARSSLSGKSSTRMMATVQSLLSVLCDAVVHLNQDFLLEQSSWKLSALLLKQSCAACGDDFLGLVDPEDRDRFVMHVQGQSATDGGGLAQSLTIHMRDGSQSWVRTRIYYASFLDSQERPRYLVGLQEVSTFDRHDCAGEDQELYSEAEQALEAERLRAEEHHGEARRCKRQPSAGASSSSDGACSPRSKRSSRLSGAIGLGVGRLRPAKKKPAGLLEDESAAEASAATSASACTSTRSGGAAGLAEGAVEPRRQDFRVTFRLCEGLPILRATQSFQRLAELGMASAGRPLLPWIQDGAQFYDRIQSEVQRLSAVGQPCIAAELCVGPIRLRPPGDTTAEIEFWSQCYLHIDELQAEGGATVVQAEFRDLFQRRSMLHPARAELAPEMIGSSFDGARPLSL